MPGRLKMVLGLLFLLVDLGLSWWLIRPASPVSRAVLKSADLTPALSSPASPLPSSAPTSVAASILAFPKIEDFTYQNEAYRREGAKILQLLQPRRRYRLQLDSGQEVVVLLDAKTFVAQTESLVDGVNYRLLESEKWKLFQVDSRVIVTYRSRDLRGGTLIPKEFVFVK